MVVVFSMQQHAYVIEKKPLPGSVACIQAEPVRFYYEPSDVVPFMFLPI